MPSYLLGLAALVAASPTNGQSWTPLPSSPFAAANYAHIPAADLAAGASAELEVTDVQLAGGIPFRGMGAVGVLGLDYQYTHNEYSGIDGRDRDLHRLQIPVSVGGTYREMRLVGTVAPGVATSSNVFKDPFGEMTADDLFVTGRVTATWSFGAGRLAQLGVAYDRSFGDPTVYPVAAVELLGDRRLQVRLAFPDPAVRFQWNDRHQWSARLFPAGQQWHVVSEEIDDDFDYEMKALRAQLTWSWRARQSLVVDVSAGWEFGRQHEFTDDLATRFSAEADDQLFVVIGLRRTSAPILYSQGSRTD